MKPIALFIASLLSLSLSAQVSFRASVNQTQVTVGQRFAVEFKVNQNGDDFKAPSFQGFQVLGGPNTSVSTYMDNSGTRYTLSYSYVLRARKAGEYSIDPAFIKVEGKTYRTEPITIKVVERSEEQKQQKRSPEVFLRPLVSKSEVYQGEPIYARYRLYFRSEVGQYSFNEEPSFRGFYKQDIEQKRIDSEEEYIDGKRYVAADLRRWVMIPQDPGSYQPGMVDLQVPTMVNSGRRDIFGFAITRRETVDCTEEFPRITVKPLPENGRPRNFSGAVGQYQLKASVSNRKIDTDGSLSLKIEIEGKGNIKLVELPQPDFPQAFEVFDPEVKERISVGSYGMQGTKTVEYLLVPRYAGTYKIGPIRFNYFDPKTGRYRELESEVFEIEVSGGQVAPLGSANTTQAPGTDESETVDFIGKDILFIKTETEQWSKVQDRFWNTTLYWLLFGGILLAGLFSYFFFLKQEQDRSNFSELRSQRAGKMARKRLSIAKKALDAQDNDGFYQELLRGIWSYFADKGNLGASKLSKDYLAERLQQAEVPQDLQARFFALIDRAEMARYTQQQAGEAARDYQEATELLTQIDRLL